MKNIKNWIIAALLFVTAIQWGHATWIFGKAQLAQWLIADSWSTTLQTQLNNDIHNQEQHNKPWSWADIWPVARLQWLPETPATIKAQTNTIKKDMFVLSGAHGEALAFGPGHLHGTATPGTGFSVIAGHRDTHFDFLEHVKKDDLLKIQTLHGDWKSYRIQTTEIRHIKRDPLLIDETQEGLLLITCYPFNSLSVGGPYRYIVWATPEQRIEQQSPQEDNETLLTINNSTMRRFAM